MGILDTIMNFIYQIICFFYSLLPIKWDKCNICPRDTCIHQHSDEDFTMPYSSELNLNSSCDDIKNFIITNLESIKSDAFQSSDGSSITDSMKKVLIFVLENSSTMITNDDGSISPGIRFKFCCPTEEHCLL